MRTDGRTDGKHDEAKSHFFPISRPRARMCYFSGGHVPPTEIGQNSTKLRIYQEYLFHKCVFFRGVIRESTVRRLPGQQNSRDTMEPEASYSRPDTDL
jgi:hypothetical protein